MVLAHSTDTVAKTSVSLQKKENMHKQYKIKCFSMYQLTLLFCWPWIYFLIIQCTTDPHAACAIVVILAFFPFRLTLLKPNMWKKYWIWFLLSWLAYFTKVTEYRIQNEHRAK